MVYKGQTGSFSGVRKVAQNVRTGALRAPIPARPFLAVRAGHAAHGKIRTRPPDLVDIGLNWP